MNALKYLAIITDGNGRWAEQRGLPVSPHLLPEISVQLGCGLAAVTSVEYMPWLYPLFANPPALVNEVYRVLKPGGKVLAVAPAKYDVDYFARLAWPWRRWFGPPAADDGKFSARRLKRLFGHFVEHRIHKRQVRRADVPAVWRWLPRHILERLMGRVLVVKAFKPLSAALPTQAAA